MRFSRRTGWPRRPNKLAALLEERRKSGKPVYDLTVSNPTEVGIGYPEIDLAASLSDPRVLRYEPDPRGLLSARETISEYYDSTWNITADPSSIFLTSSTSEAYSILFKLLCDPGEEILIPRPTYPLFDSLARLSDVTLGGYRLEYDDVWRVDLDSVEAAIGKSTRAVVIVNPHNPTGMFLKQDEYRAIKEMCAQHSIPIITDEVFLEFPLHGGNSRISTAGEQDILSFTLNGISKMAGLPQLKLGWIVVGGPPADRTEAAGRLEIVSDTFLSVNTPVQIALPEIMEAGDNIRENLLARLRSNYGAMLAEVPSGSACSVLQCEGGWYGIIRVPNVKSDEEWAVLLLEETGFYLFPGYFFDFETEGYLVVSLLVKEEVFRKGITALVDCVESMDPDTA